MRKSASVFIPSTARKYTLPPSPPSPPSGPPKGTNFSRRKLTQPRPPLPACTLSLASSTNFMIDSMARAPCGAPMKKGAGRPTPFGCMSASRKGPRASLLGNDVDEHVPLGTLDAKFDHPVRLGKQGVIRTDPDV